MKYHLTNIEQRALECLALAGPQLPSEVGCVLWPETSTCRKRQVLARSAVRVLARLRDLGLVEDSNKDDGRRFWQLTQAGVAHTEERTRAAGAGNASGLTWMELVRLAKGR